jgi:enoyl-CoA hydratase/carnithine racemase
MSGGVLNALNIRLDAVLGDKVVDQLGAHLAQADMGSGGQRHCPRKTPKPLQWNMGSVQMMVALDGALAEAAADERVRVIVLEAAGKVFCAGHDLAELRASDDPRQHESLFERCSALMMAVGACRAPVIARVQGAAVAAGCQLVASCDLAYAAATAQFAVPGINLGLFCSTPGVALGRAVGRKASMDLLLTGRFIDASRAVALGLINLAVPGEDLDAVIDDTARIIAAKPPEAIALGKTTFRRQMEASLVDAYVIASRAMVENLAFPGARAGIDGFLKR